MRQLVKDRLDRGMPHKWLGVAVGGTQVSADGMGKLWNAGKATSPDTLLGEVSEPSLHKVHPGRAGRDEVQVETRVSAQPFLHIGLSVGPVIVQDQVEGHVSRELPVQSPQEAQELLVPVARETLPNHPPVQNIERRKKRGDTVPQVVMGHGSTAPLFYGQPGLGALQGLNLALLVNTQDNGLIGRVQVQPYDISELLGETRVSGELESLGTVRLKSVSVPYPVNSGVADALGLGHGACAPVSSTWRLGLGCQFHNLGNSFRAIDATSSPTGLYLGQGIDSAALETSPPQDHRRATDSQLLCDTVVGATSRGQQDNLRPHNDTLGGTRRGRPSFQSLTLCISNRQRHSWIPHAYNHEPSTWYCQAISETVD